MHTIALEEHHASPEYVAKVAPELRDYPGLTDKLCEAGDRRIAEMDSAGIDVQVLSLGTPGVEQLDAAEAVAVAREENDCRAAIVHAYPERFAGFATVPTAAPQAAADELERTVREYGFRGVLINGHTRGRYLDDAFFAPILERTEALGVPLYLHPAPPPQAVIDASYGGLAPWVTARLATWAWGWHIETAVHVLRLIVSGVFDRYPGLQVIVGHLGEGLASMMPRIEAGLPAEVIGLSRPVGAYFRENLHYTISGFTYDAVFLDLLLQVGADRIMFSTDYPNWPMSASRKFLDHLPVNPDVRERIAHGNAERLLQLADV
jgi:uncharacterized protein